MELRVNNDVDAIATPTGFIPIYSDLAELFKKELGKEFHENLYERLFTIRVENLLAKYERIWKIYSKIPDTPKRFFEILTEQKRRLEDAKNKYGPEISPFKLDRK
jgi:phosphoenolpyruvate carboxykinase (GTP)